MVGNGRDNEVSLIFCRGFLERYKSLLASGQLFEEWRNESSDDRRIACFEADRQLWIVRADLGGISFNRHPKDIFAFPADSVDSRYFESVVKHDWLPFVYPFWRSQVLHASAAVHLSTGLVAAFAGPSGSGKSTVAYGLGNRPGWNQLADDSLAFRVDEQKVELVAIPNDIRLRPKSADYFGTTSYNGEQLQWLDKKLEWRSICFLKPVTSIKATVTRLKATEAYPSLLTQAFTLTTRRRDLNRRVMRDYLTLTRFTRAFQLSYPMRFDSLAETIDLIENVCLNGSR